MYGLSTYAHALSENYLSNRKQCEQIDDSCCSFLEIIKVVPQVSILGSPIFNIFINDIFYFMNQAKLFYYADDITVSFSHLVFATLKSILEEEVEPLSSVSRGIS